MLSPSVMALHTSQWHIAMPSGGGIHAINRAVTANRRFNFNLEFDIEGDGVPDPVPNFVNTAPLARPDQTEALAAGQSAVLEVLWQ